MQTSNSTPAIEGRLWTASNLLSLLRLVLALPASYTLWNGMRGLTIGLFIFAAVTDVLDGYLARKLNEISEFGKILDPLADKIFVGVIVTLMLINGMFPVWFVAIVLLRDITIFLGGLYVKQRTGEVLPSNYPGKIAVLILSLTLLLRVAGISETVMAIMMGISLLLLAISFSLYLIRAVQVLRAPAAPVLADLSSKP